MKEAIDPRSAGLEPREPDDAIIAVRGGDREPARPRMRRAGGAARSAITAERQDYQGDANEMAGPQTRAEAARVEAEYERLDAQDTEEAFNELNGVLDKLADTVVHTLDGMDP